MAKTKPTKRIEKTIHIDLEDIIDWTREDFIDHLATDIDEYLNMNIEYTIVSAESRTITLNVEGDTYGEES